MGRFADEQRDAARPSATPRDLQPGYPYLPDPYLDEPCEDDDDGVTRDPLEDGSVERVEALRVEDLGPSENRLSDEQVANTQDSDAAQLADRVNRMVEDEELLRRLREAGFDSEEGHLLRDELIRYGWQVLNSFLYNGSIFGHAARVKRAVSCPDWLREQLRHCADDRQDISCELVFRVLPRFWQAALVGGGWRSDGGAKITTYFTNALLLEFSNVFGVWQRQQRRQIVDKRDLSYEVSPEREADERHAVLQELSELKPREREIVALHYDDFSHAEIVELTGAASERAVEGVLYRWRCKHPRYLEQREQRGEVSHG